MAEAHSKNKEFERVDPQAIKSFISQLDHDCDGRISFQDLKRLVDKMQVPFTDELLSEMIREAGQHDVVRSVFNTVPEAIDFNAIERAVSFRQKHSGSGTPGKSWKILARPYRQQWIHLISLVVPSHLIYFISYKPQKLSKSKTERKLKSNASTPVVRVEEVPSRMIVDPTRPNSVRAPHPLDFMNSETRYLGDEKELPINTLLYQNYFATPPDPATVASSFKSNPQATDPLATILPPNPFTISHGKNAGLLVADRIPAASIKEPPLFSFQSQRLFQSLTQPETTIARPLRKPLAATSSRPPTTRPISSLASTSRTSTSSGPPSPTSVYSATGFNSTAAFSTSGSLTGRTSSLSGSRVQPKTQTAVQEDVKDIEFQQALKLSRQLGVPTNSPTDALEESEPVSSGNQFVTKFHLSDNQDLRRSFALYQSEYFRGPYQPPSTHKFREEYDYAADGKPNFDTALKKDRDFSYYEAENSRLEEEKKSNRTQKSRSSIRASSVNHFNSSRPPTTSINNF